MNIHSAVPLRSSSGAFTRGRRHIVACSANPPSPPTTNRRALLSCMLGSALISVPLSASAVGLESFDLPIQIETPEVLLEMKRRQQATLDAAEDAFQQSSLLRELKARSEANREEHDRQLRNRYCMRQAELGVGDCAGLRLIPGATKSGLQKRPEWMESLPFLGGGDGGNGQ